MKITLHKKVIWGVGALAFCGFTSVILYQKSVPKNLDDVALLSIIKNDQKEFENYLSAGGTLDTILHVEGNNYSVGELIVKYERLDFVKYSLNKSLKFNIDLKKDFDVYSLSVTKNNSAILSLLTQKKPNLTSKTYGLKNWTLLHMASAECSSKVISVLHQAGMSWNLKAKDGSTPLTLAAEKGCLDVLSYWKNQGADFRMKDGRGLTALSLLSKHKDAAALAFAESFATKRMPASVVASTELNFYKKRLIPKDNLADRAHLIEPEDRPDDANETAEYSEFSD